MNNKFELMFIIKIKKLEPLLFWGLSKTKSNYKIHFTI